MSSDIQEEYSRSKEMIDKILDIFIEHDANMKQVGYILAELQTLILLPLMTKEDLLKIIENHFTKRETQNDKPI